MLGFIALTFTTSAEVKVLFSEDFEWIEPWCLNNGAVDWIKKTNEMTHQAIKISKTDADGVSLYDAMTAKGYDFVYVHHSEKTDQEPAYYVMMQQNYLKFGTTGYNSGLVLPAIAETREDENYTLEFDWMPMRQGSPTTAEGTRPYDNTQLVVIVRNGEDESQIEVVPHTLGVGEEPHWIKASVSLAGKQITPLTRLIIRQIDSQWPVDKDVKLGTKTVCRYFLDNIKLISNGSAGIEEIQTAEGNTEYYTLQGIRVERPTKGVFIMRHGSKFEKVIVK